MAKTVQVSKTHKLKFANVGHCGTGTLCLYGLAILSRRRCRHTYLRLHCATFTRRRQELGPRTARPRGRVG